MLQASKKKNTDLVDTEGKKATHAVVPYDLRISRSLKHGVIRVKLTISQTRFAFGFID